MALPKFSLAAQNLGGLQPPSPPPPRTPTDPRVSVRPRESRLYGEYKENDHRGQNRLKGILFITTN